MYGMGCYFQIEFCTGSGVNDWGIFQTLKLLGGGAGVMYLTEDLCLCLGGVCFP